MLMALMKSSLIQRIHKTQASDIVHSSGYAKVQHNQGGGPHSGMSFSARMKVDQNRTVVKGYGSSMIMQNGNKMPAATSVGGQGTEADAPVPVTPRSQQQDNHYGWSSSRDTVASWGYKSENSLNNVANTTAIDNTNSNWGYGRTAGSKESLTGYGRTSGGRESLHKGYGRMSSADASSQKTGYANAAAQRQARAARFSASNGRTGSSTSRPPINPTFGRR